MKRATKTTLRRCLGPSSLALLIAVSATATGCGGETEATTSPDNPRRSVDPEIVPETKRIRRMTADQFLDSLEVATGHRWGDEDDFAATLGRPDFDEVTEQGREMSVGFAKLAGDAARETCRRAVDGDLALQDAAARTVLRHMTSVEPLDPFDAGVMDNLRYLVLRFHGVYVTDDADERLRPWLTILQGGVDQADPERTDGSADRWVAVCAGLALHPDFLTY